MADLNSNINIDADDVREIIDTDLTDAQLHAFMNAAYFRTLPLAGNLGNCGGSDALDEIQKYVTAHLITLREPETEQETVDEVSVKYRGKTDMGLNGSRYGQTAITLDCSGILAKAGLKKASINFWDHARIDYDYDNDDYGDA